MAITSTSLSLGNAQALATQVDALTTAIAAINAGTAGSPPKGSAAHNALIAQQALAQTDLVNTLLASNRLDPAAVITSCSINTKLDSQTDARISNYGTQITAGKNNGDLSTQVTAARIQAIHTHMNTGRVSAATILSTMS